MIRIALSSRFGKPTLNPAKVDSWVSIASAILAYHSALDSVLLKVKMVVNFEIAPTLPVLHSKSIVI